MDYLNEILIGLLLCLHGYAIYEIRSFRKWLVREYTSHVQSEHELSDLRENGN